MSKLIIVKSIVLKFHNHPSIKMIKNKFRKTAPFSFQQVTLINVRKPIKDTRLGKSSSRDVPADILKQCNLCFQALISCINQSKLVESFQTR